MRAYRFSLAPVARVRALQERVARDQLVLSQQRVRRAEMAVHAAASALRALTMPDGPMTAADFVWIGDQAERLSASVLRCERDVADALSTRDASRRAWKLAAQRAGVLERLDERELELWRADMLRQEAAELDDLAQVRHGRSGAVP